MKVTGSSQQTVDNGDAVCWSNMTVADTDADASTLTHDCFVRSGVLSEEVSVTINQDHSFSTVAFGPADTAAVQAMKQSLAVYGE